MFIRKEITIDIKKNSIGRKIDGIQVPVCPLPTETEDGGVWQ